MSHRTVSAPGRAPSQSSSNLQTRPRARSCLLVYEPPDGGVAAHVRELALGLPAHGWLPFVAGPDDSMIYPDLRAAGVPIARLPLRPGLGWRGDDARALRRLVGLLRGDRFSAVHAHSARAGVLARIAALGAGTPAIYSPHCFPFVGPTGPRRLVSIALERALGPLSAAIVCAADQERLEAREHRIAAPGRLAVIRYGTPPAEPEPESDPELARFKGAHLLAGCICVLRAQKSVDVLIDAAPRILDRAPGARLAVIGNGELRGQLEARAAALGLGGRLAFFDFKGPPARQLRSLDLFVLPSSWEALPISVLEAMACGVPQVATDVGGTAEGVRDGVTGLLCPPGDPGALADRVVRVLTDDGLRAAMAASSRAVHEAEFRSERMVADVAALYDRVASA